MCMLKLLLTPLKFRIKPQTEAIYLLADEDV